MRLGKREIDALTCPPGRRDIIVFDDDLPGFGLRVTEAGNKVFLLQYQVGGRGGRRVRLVLGRYGELTHTEARKLAETARSQVRAGRDPKGEREAAAAEARHVAEQRKRQAEAEAFTFDILIERWVEIALADRSEGHRAEAPRALRACFPGMMSRPAAAIENAAVQRVIDGLAQRKPVMARRVRDYGRAAFNWAVHRHLVVTNPFDAIVIEGREISRDRVLNDTELGEAWRAAGSLGYPFGPFLQLLILTLQRRGEVAGLRWRELSPDLATWTLPADRTKNRTEHIVHLVEPARMILRSLPCLSGATLMFPALPQSMRGGRLAGAAAKPSAVRSAHRLHAITGFSDAKERLAQAIAKERAAEVEKRGKDAPPLPAIDWRLHDFRRTGVTVLARLGVAPHVADRLLNHVQGSTIRGVMATYQRHDFAAERKAALQLWARHVLAVAARQAMPDNVIELKSDQGRS